MKASEDLRNEHELIKVTLHVLDQVVRRIKQNEQVEVSDLQDIVGFLSEFADKCHHGKEEGFYFPALEQAGIPKEGGPIGLMLNEHDLGRSNIKQMRESVFGNNVDLQSFAQAAVSYIILMSNHIEKENNVLFMMGDMRLPEETQNELLEKFEEHEKAVIGEGRHQELHALLEKLEQKYLS